jgi:phosphorylcholine metabolism protein LicD
MDTNIIFLTIIIFIVFMLLYRNNFNLFSNTNKILLSDKLSKDDIVNLKKGQKIMSRMLKEFNRICRKYNIKYWCIGGTLIGAMRHRGWIPWDADLDIGMLKEDYIKFKRVSANELNKEYSLTEPKNKACFKIRTNKAIYAKTLWSADWDSNEGLQLDIFVFETDSDKKHIYSKNCSVVGRPDKYKRLYSDIFPLKQLYFDNIKVYVPNKYKIISKEVWGDYPPKLIDIPKRYPHEGLIKIL